MFGELQISTDVDDRVVRFADTAASTYSGNFRDHRTKHAEGTDVPAGTFTTIYPYVEKTVVVGMGIRGMEGML